MRLNRMSLLASTALRSADGVGTADAPQAQTTEPKKLTMDDIVAKYFPPESIATDGIAYLETVKSIAGDKISANFDGDTTIPDNYGLFIGPVSARSTDGTGNKVMGAIACVVPTLELLGASEAGVSWLREAALSAMRTKIANAVRPDKNGDASGEIPFTLEDFIENRRESGVMKAYNETAPIAVASLKKLGFKFMTVPLLRQVLVSKAFAESQFPKVDQKQWVAVLDLLVNRATAKGFDTSVLANWKATRDNAAASEMADFDVGKLDELMAGAEAKAA